MTLCKYLLNVQLKVKKEKVLETVSDTLNTVTKYDKIKDIYKAMCNVI